MKKILLLFLFSINVQAQTTYKQVDIQAASGNDYETLLTNVVSDEYDDFRVYKLLRDLGYNTTTYLKPIKKGYDFTIKYDKEKNNNESVYAHFIVKKINETPVTTKIEIYGDVKSVIRYFINFWSTTLNFEDVKVGEIVSCKFLSDVATLSFPDSKTAKITVVSVKDR